MTRHDVYFRFGCISRPGFVNIPRIEAELFAECLCTTAKLNKPAQGPKIQSSTGLLLEPAIPLSESLDLIRKSLPRPARLGVDTVVT